ncbi:hypothetical protein AX289_27030 [Methylorubrum populi]|nr:hypothetical protein AX289_27030 [Methylorubrum populi]
MVMAGMDGPRATVEVAMVAGSEDTARVRGSTVAAGMEAGTWAARAAGSAAGMVASSTDAVADSVLISA